MDMEIAARLILWGSFIGLFFAYIGFPVVIFICSRLFGHRPVPPPYQLRQHLPTVTILISALNEEAVIRERLENVLSIDYPPDKLETVIASDGSTDRTCALVRQYAETYPGRVRLLEYWERRGKATVLNSVVQQLQSDIVVFSDANTMFHSQAVMNLIRWFQDPAIGAVCGQLRLHDAATGKNVDGLYWRYENLLKDCEGRLGALLGANGAIYAMRRTVFVPIPGDTIVDDFVIPLFSKLRFKHRTIYDTAAIATEETAPDIEGEFRRRCRIGAGNFQSLSRLWPLLFPTQGWISFVFFSHKILRWFCPAFLLLALMSNIWLSDQSTYQWLLLAQTVFYVAAYLGHRLAKGTLGNRVVRLVTMFVAMNIALAVGFWRWVTGQQQGTWQRTIR